MTTTNTNVEQLRFACEVIEKLRERHSLEVAELPILINKGNIAKMLLDGYRRYKKKAVDEVVDLVDKTLIDSGLEEHLHLERLPTIVLPDAEVPARTKRFIAAAVIDKAADVLGVTLEVMLTLFYNSVVYAELDATEGSVRQTMRVDVIKDFLKEVICLLLIGEEDEDRETLFLELKARVSVYYNHLANIGASF